MSGLDILIVEDEASLAELYGSVASTAGHHVAVVANGYDALEKIQGRRFDLILLDINLGHGPDGFDVLSAIRDLDRGERVVMITARGSPHDIETGLVTLRADNYLVKPMGREMFRIRLQAEVRQVQKVAPSAATFRIDLLTIRIENETCSLIIGEYVKRLRSKPSSIFIRLLSAPAEIHTPEMLAPIVLGFAEERYTTPSEKAQIHLAITRMRADIDRFIEQVNESLPVNKRLRIAAADIIENVYGKGWRCNLTTAGS